MKNYTVLFGILLIGFVSCKNKKEVAQKETEKVEETKSTPKIGEFGEVKSMAPFSKEVGGNLTGKRWKAVEIMGKVVEMPEGMTQGPFITYSKNGTFTAYDGCNTIFGDYKLGVKNIFQMMNFSQTEKECSFTSFQEDLMQALTLSGQYVLTGEDDLQIIIGKRAPLAKFKAVYLD